MLNLGSLAHPHGLEEAHVVHRLGPDQLGEVKDPFMTFCTASRTGWTPFEAPKTKALGGEEEQTTPFLNRDKENRNSLRSLGSHFLMNHILTNIYFILLRILESPKDLSKQTLNR